MKLDLMAIAKEVVTVSYAELDDGDKELSRQIASIMFPAFCAKVRRLYEVGASTRGREKDRRMARIEVRFKLEKEIKAGTGEPSASEAIRHHSCCDSIGT